MWRLYGADGSDKDYEIFKIPFINVVDKVFSKVRNLTYRYMPNQLTLFPMETEQYNSWLIRELLNNCIAHTNYQLGGRIYVNEFEDKIKFTNPGDFIPQKIENVLEVSYNPPFYRNQLLAESMVVFHMIDTATLGIRRAFNIQKKLHGMPGKKPIRIAVPVNLRPYFDSDTTKNFFVMVSAEFRPQKESYTFEEVLACIQSSLHSQINKEHLEDLFSYSVSNQRNLLMRPVPLFLKNIAMRIVYEKSAVANTTTITNIGNIKIKDIYQPYIEGFSAFIAMSKGQYLKGSHESRSERFQKVTLSTTSLCLRSTLNKRAY